MDFQVQKKFFYLCILGGPQQTEKKEKKTNNNRNIKEYDSERSLLCLTIKYLVIFFQWTVLSLI